MRYLLAEHFKKQLKKLVKKHPHLKEDLLNTLNKLDLSNETHIGKSIYKIRINSSDLQKGKSGGFRSYIYLYKQKSIIVPLCIYAKGKQKSISENELRYHFDRTNEELIEIFS